MNRDELDPDDPLNGMLETPTLTEQIEPYRQYGDDELAVTLLHFQKRESMCVASLNPGERTRFDVRSQPASVGFTFHCPECKENVREVRIPGETLCRCPLCGEEPGLLALGSGLK